MRIVIVGPGALGCLVGGLLSKKAEVWLLDRDPKRAERIIKNQGITCQGASGKWTAKIPATAKAADIGEADLIILCVKAYHTKEALLHARDCIRKDTTVLTLQNGLGHIEVIKEFVDEQNLLVGVTNHGVTLIGEGQIQHAGTGETIIGNLEGFLPARARQIREIFNESGLDTKLSRNIKGVLWSKLIINCGINPVSALTRLKNGQLMHQETCAEVIRGAVTEAVRVAKRGRVQLVYDDPLAKVESVCEATGPNRSSMLQDVLARKKTEIDFINGVILRQARSYGIPTPVNQLLVNLVKTIESSYGEMVDGQGS